ncbi:TRAP transporter substrate-binding protein DctP [Sulfurospirillum sp. T05]|uniref:TRAP transporter substrate-binding protein DctP n=1 Tax=Sulfurospirillum tamanense TaxID=2813362 RepID=A0ABS2WPR9_9BACT|nr:TRAP transporter substrate-binding protein DctP [Sulfurospirillum tamanensis]MBN2963398.1 TRAP transporter substrate-binding protein DctP [Sulfurospirillum tamanensis]
MRPSGVLRLVLMAFFLMSSMHAATWKYAMGEGESDPQGIYAMKFKEEIEKNSDHKIQVYPVGTLGEEADILEQAQAGLLQFIGQSTGYMGASIPEMDVFFVPYLMPTDPQQLDTFFRNSKAINEMFPEIFRKHGLELLAMFPEGEQVVTTMEEFRSPEDLRGKKIRVMPGSPLLIETYRAFGASPTPMSWGDLIGALKTNMVDGQENPTVWIEAYGLDELTKVMTYMGHNHFTAAAMAESNFFNSLSDADKKLIKNASDAALKHILKVAQELDATGLEKIKKKNPSYKIVRLSEKERDAFRKRVVQVEKSFVEKAGKSGEGILKQMKADLKAAMQ